jgi:threonine/homoserine/homoserine lactone efflux protein
MPDFSVLLIFIPTWFLVSISPGLCMSLAMSLGMTVGLAKTVWMMIGELVGVALVAMLSVLGVASFLLQFPTVFNIVKVIGGIYIIYVGISTWLTKVEIESIDVSGTSNLGVFPLMMKGFVTAVFNPKGWAFMVSLLPPFFDPTKPLYLQLGVFMLIILISELVCMLLYASGGHSLRKLLNNNDNAQYINKIGGALLIGVGIWLVVL